MLHSNLGLGVTPLTPPQLDHLITQSTASAIRPSSPRSSTSSPVSPSSPSLSINSKPFSLFKSSKHDIIKSTKQQQSHPQSHVQPVSPSPSSPQMTFAPASSSSSSSPPPSSRIPSAPIPFPASSSPYVYNPHPSTITEVSNSGHSQHSRTSSTFHEDVLAPGDIIGVGLTLRDEMPRIVPMIKHTANLDGSWMSNGSAFSSRPSSRPGTGTRSIRSSNSFFLPPAMELEVVRRLGTGSYAIVYLAREVLRRSTSISRPPSATTRYGADDEFIGGQMDDFGGNNKAVVNARGNGGDVAYGREFAVKCLSKANLDEEALSAQMAEATIHSLVPPHPNVVTLHRTLETPSFLLLILEFVPGEDLFYFLKQARDQFCLSPDGDVTASVASYSNGNGNGNGNGKNSNGYSGNGIDLNGRGNGNGNGSSSSDTGADGEDESNGSGCSSRTPPTPSLLTTFNAGQLLSKTRLKLIASMFSQMCDAVAVCHDAGVFHRDIKPENFIVTDGWDNVPVLTPTNGTPTGQSNRDGATPFIRRERRVIVKLTDFGLSTTDVESGDMDCGSAPYMSYECRNNCAPTYSPRAADVWSLGIVLINLLYHVNPWSDTTQGECASFSAFRADPVGFWESHFEGMTKRVAKFLAERVFCILDDDDPLDTKGKRISARDFGLWVRGLISWFDPALDDEDTIIASSPTFQHPVNHAIQTSHKRGISISTTSSVGFSVSSVPPSRRPSSRQPSLKSPVLPTSALSPTSALMEIAGTNSSEATITNGNVAMTSDSKAGTRPGTPASRGRALSRTPTLLIFGPVLDEELEDVERRTYGYVFSPENDKRGEPEPEIMEVSTEAEHDNDNDNEAEIPEEERNDGTSREPSIARKRKRGARKGKGGLQQQVSQSQLSALAVSQSQNAVSSTMPEHSTSADALASLNQSLVRELSRASRSSHHNAILSGSVPVSAITSPVTTPGNFPPVPMVQGVDHSLPPHSATHSHPTQLQYPVNSRSAAFPHAQSSSTTPHAAVPGANLSNNFTHVLNSNNSGYISIYNNSISTSNSGPGFGSNSRSASGRGSLTSSSMSSSSNKHMQRNRDRSPVSMFPIPAYALRERQPRPLLTQQQLRSGSNANVSSGATNLSTAVLAPQAIVKKPSKWKLGFGKSHAHSTTVSADRPEHTSQVQGQGHRGHGYPYVEQRLPYEQHGHGPPLLAGVSASNPIAIMDAALQSTAVLTPQDNAEAVGVEGGENGVPSAMAHNVTSLLMGLNSSVVNNANLTSSSSSSFSPTSSSSSTASQVEKKQPNAQVSVVSLYPSSAQASHIGFSNASHSQASLNFSHSNSNRNRDQGSASTSSSDMWPRGRRAKASVANGPSGTIQQGFDGWIDSTPEDPMLQSNGQSYEKRNTSPVSTRTSAVRMPMSSASSTAPSSKSNNWRNSGYSSHSSSTTSSAYTRFSNGSIRSVSTAATSVSGSDSWRNPSSASLASQKPAQYDPTGRPPSNVKLMSGVPYGLMELPRGIHPDPDTEFSASAIPGRKQRMRKPKDLPTISERPAPKSSPLSQRHDAHTSSTDINRGFRSGNTGHVGGSGIYDDDRLSPEGSESTTNDSSNYPRKVQKGQITALAKMLNAFRL